METTSSIQQAQGNVASFSLLARTREQQQQQPVISLVPPFVLFSFSAAPAMTSSSTEMASVRSSIFHSPINELRGSSSDAAAFSSGESNSRHQLQDYNNKIGMTTKLMWKHLQQNPNICCLNLRCFATCLF